MTLSWGSDEKGMYSKTGPSFRSFQSCGEAFEKVAIFTASPHCLSHLHQNWLTDLAFSIAP